ncbi:uncharacterized protein LOC124473770 isoform X2 [Hypomesus transpacificus]|uniref:uncharacterized protein LOC124473770 isoform X2 n=1 Tax=Hypomesus transpacificus TaxID=137520 RepID=UPI001F08492F|nr:uncharacterized protein LOC124473770 isoform X2 [Hypomesus transpacificus]
MDSLQYYSISASEAERRPRERPMHSPLPSPRKGDLLELEQAEDGESYERPHTAASPALSAPRSNTSSPALGPKPTMFKVKDNTFRGSILTKTIRPRFYKSLEEDSRVASPLDGWRGGGEKADEGQEKRRVSSVTNVPTHRSPVVQQSPVPSSLTHTHDYPSSLSEHREYRARSRRSLALDEEDSRSVFSTMSEDVDSFATSAGDLGDFRGAYDSDWGSRGGYERPDSACSFSSDAGRPLGKPPTVPPKTEKALRRAKRLTTRRIKKESSNTSLDRATSEDNPLREVSSVPSSPSDLRSSGRSALSSPHFSSPISLPHTPTLVSSVSSTAELRPSHRSFHASPHATAPVSLPLASPHHCSPISLPLASPHATAPVSLALASPHHSSPISVPLAPRSVSSVPSSPTQPLTQYHVEPSYPLTQRKVLQDPGSGQYFVVDMPVPVKTKTFFDPETGKYVQLNVRKSGQTGPQPQPQPQVLYTQQEPDSGRQSRGWGQENHGRVRSRSSLGCVSQESSHRQVYSPGQAPYMDTGYDVQTSYAPTPCDTHKGSDTRSQQGEGIMYDEKEDPAPSGPPGRDIITMSELEDFAMDSSDW